MLHFCSGSEETGRWSVVLTSLSNLLQTQEEHFRGGEGSHTGSTSCRLSAGVKENQRYSSSLGSAERSETVSPQADVETGVKETMRTLESCSSISETSLELHEEPHANVDYVMYTPWLRQGA